MSSAELMKISETIKMVRDNVFLLLSALQCPSKARVNNCGVILINFNRNCILFFHNNTLIYQDERTVEYDEQNRFNDLHSSAELELFNKSLAHSFNFGKKIVKPVNNHFSGFHKNFQNFVVKNSGAK